MTESEKLLTIKNRLFRDICNIFQSHGIDVALGVLMLKAIEADLMDLGYEAITERLMRQEEQEEQEAVENDGV